MKKKNVKYINRDISWLPINGLVLDEAKDHNQSSGRSWHPNSLQTGYSCAKISDWINPAGNSLQHYFSWSNPIPPAYIADKRESPYFFSYPNPLSPKLEVKSFPPVNKKDLESYPSMLKAIRYKVWMLYFPHHSIDPAIRFLNEAAMDPKVREINTTQ